MGRPLDPRRKVLMERYGVSVNQAHRLLPPVLDQIVLCQSDLARRLILGKTQSEDEKDDGAAKNGAGVSMR